jgi:hypothetical protein
LLFSEVLIFYAFIPKYCSVADKFFTITHMKKLALDREILPPTRTDQKAHTAAHSGPCTDITTHSPTSVPPKSKR